MRRRVLEAARRENCQMHAEGPAVTSLQTYNCENWDRLRHPLNKHLTRIVVYATMELPRLEFLIVVPIIVKLYSYLSRKDVDHSIPFIFKNFNFS